MDRRRRSGPPFDAIQKEGTLRLATEGYYAPFAHFEGKQLTGFEVELAQMLAGKMGVKYEWKTISFDALLTGLQQDRWDLVISSHGITPEREKAVTFTQPHYCSGAIVMSLDPAIRSGKDLAGKTVSVQTGTTYLQYMEKNLPGIKRLVNFPTNEAARNALLSKRVDAWVTERFIARNCSRRTPMPSSSRASCCWSSASPPPWPGQQVAGRRLEQGLQGRPGRRQLRQAVAEIFPRRHPLP